MGSIYEDSWAKIHILFHRSEGGLEEVWLEAVFRVAEAAGGWEGRIQMGRM